MRKLWILLAVSLVIAWIIDYRDKLWESSGEKKRDRFFTWLLIVILGFFCGLRTWGNDTVTYLQIYDQMPSIDNYFHDNMIEFAEGIGFGILTSIIKTLGISSQGYLMFYAFATIVPYVLFVRKYSKSMILGVFLMFVTGFYTFTLAAIKQCMATGICLLAVSAALDRKWIKYCVLLGIAVLFHPYSIVYLLVIVLMFKPWTKKTFLCVGIFTVMGFYLDTLIGPVLDITDMIGANYTESSFTGEGVNIFRVMACFAPMILAILYGAPLFRHSTRENNLMFNLSMVNGLIMFVGLFGTANYFARLANYFLPGQIIALPWIFRTVHPKDRRWLVPACVVGYLGYFIYENAIIRPFDTGYTHLSFWTYISSLI